MYIGVSRAFLTTIVYIAIIDLFGSIVAEESFLATTGASPTGASAFP